jgi:hypothetical protein
MGHRREVLPCAALSGALHEAGSARRLAALRGGTRAVPGAGAGTPAGAVSVLTSDEVASHELLLTVPPSVVRSFREQMLGPCTYS